ncbi:MAG: cytochrome P450 [Pseudomonadales bacterium]|nr:cytochrome P450 [Pseudomonadales bacterium]
MSNAPTYSIEPQRFWADPYRDYSQMPPIVYVPELDATLITRHVDIAVNEKKTNVFSSWQPQGLMTVLMGENLMRKDGRDHMTERKAIYPSMSPQVVKSHWCEQFRDYTDVVIAALEGATSGDLFWRYAMPVSAHALRVMTGLTNMSAAEMNRVSQGMIDGCANYVADAAVEAHCHACTASIDAHIDDRLAEGVAEDDLSLLGVQLRAGLTIEQLRANIKLSISGGQNEPRDAIAGTIWALLAHPEQLEKCVAGQVSWLQAFEEYARWISPIGMSPRRVAQTYEYGGVRFEPEDRVFFMFGAANRDSEVFVSPEKFDVTRDIRKSLSFGAGPHFCAGAWASRALIADVALPMFFEKFADVHLDGGVPFGGWAFRGPLALPCRWTAF